MKPGVACGIVRLPWKSALQWMLVPLLFLTAPSSGASARHAPQTYDLAGLHDVVSLKGWMSYLPDPHGRHTWQSALADDGWQPLTRARLGYLDYPVWTRLKVANSAQSPRNAILFNQRPMVHCLDVFILDKGGVVERRRLGFMISCPTQGTTANRLSNMALCLPAGAARTVLTRLETRGIMEAGWDAATPAAFSSRRLREFLILGLYAGIMLALIVHGLASWFTFRRIQFGLFVGYTLFFLLLIMSINGVTRIVSLGLSPRFWFAGGFVFILGAAFWWIPFTQYFLRTAKTMPRMHRWLNVLGLLLGISAVSYILGPWVPEVYLLTPFWTGCALVLYATVMVVGVLAVRRRLAYAWLYLLGHAPAFAASGLLVALAQTSLIARFSSTLLIIPWIVIIHVLVMALSLGMMAGRAQRDLAEERRTAMDQSRFTAVGRTIGMVVHQWRTPLARLGTQLTELHAYFRDPARLKVHEARIRDELLPAMGRSMRVLTDTVEDFSDFFSAHRSRKNFDPARAMDQALEMLGGRCERLGVSVIRPETSAPITLHGHPAALVHVFMILLGNALDVLEARKVARPRVILDMEEAEGEIVLTVEDNGGGIDLCPIDRVFETFVSEKGKSHMGMGLGLARRLVEERMGGTISAENLNDGTRFTLRLPALG